jgi:membrane-bound metal-dependent hydrolase YbcI (DUF457 family)
MIQDPVLTHTLLGVVSGILIAAGLYRARGLAPVALLVAATLIIYMVVDAGVPQLERRIKDVVTVLRQHGDFFRGVVIGKGIFALLVAGFYAGRRSNRT